MGSPSPTSTYAISRPRTRRRCFWYGNAAEIMFASPFTKSWLSFNLLLLAYRREVAPSAFDVALNLAKGKNITQAALEAVRDRLPGGPAARAAFDGAVALANGKRLQDAAFAAAGRILPPSPYAADALSFVRGVANGQNIQNAALSVVGQ